ncbi:hypothetical protein NP493_1530g00000 [Ridgeia piscesae]|uniref:Uncharacterized protein n=1 Tax=Ridgeia piscesae TaxID=27915 RepID=A0AAD9K1T7_RIDPI|nr:hypothetical protein NP493_1530g00000 [Ridgeia piscesae]
MYRDPLAGPIQCVPAYRRSCCTQCFQVFVDINLKSVIVINKCACIKVVSLGVATRCALYHYKLRSSV